MPRRPDRPPHDRPPHGEPWDRRGARGDGPEWEYRSWVEARRSWKQARGSWKEARRVWRDELRARRYGYSRGDRWGHDRWHHGRRDHGPARWGLRRRLTFAFAFVALAAVMLTTWLSLGAAFRASHAAPGRAAPLAPAHEAFLAALLSFVLASFAAGLVTRFLTRPLVALTAGARRLAAGERGLRLRLPPADDELRVLTEAFNQLTEGLEREEAWRRDMVADVAHDLRTPIAVLRSEIEAMQDGVRQPDGAGLARLHGEVMMLSRLVDDLRTLSLAEAGGAPLRRVETPLRPLLERTRDAFGARAADAGVALTLEDVDPGLSAVIDPDRVQQVLGNLVDNALRHGAGAPVELAARAVDGGVLISVRDHGPGLPPGDPRRVFERFYRGDPARVRQAHGEAAGAGEPGGGTPPGGARPDAPHPDAAHPAAAQPDGPPPGRRTAGASGAGSGLGLAIVKALVEAHGGRAEAHTHADGGALFTVWLPKAPPAAREGA